MRRGQTRGRSTCPIAIALDVIGDPWTLLIVRDLMFRGASTFNDFMEAGEGIASNVLTDRLARLEANGLLTKDRDEHDRRRFIYRLTEKGVDLAPALGELVLWSARHHETDAPASTLRLLRTDRARFVSDVRRAWRKRGGGQR